MMVFVQKCIKCVSVSDKDYSTINKLSDVVLWLCEACVARIPSMKTQDFNTEDYFFKLHVLVGNLISEELRQTILKLTIGYT